MQAPACGPNCILYQSLCYCECPSYTTPANEDPTKCVPSEACASLVQNQLWSGQVPLADDSVYSLVCNKIGFQKVDACPEDYTEWRTNMCYVNCPPGTIENALTCLRKPISRPFEAPQCSNLFLWFDGSTCSMNYFTITFVVLALIFVVYLFWPTCKKY